MLFNQSGRKGEWESFSFVRIKVIFGKVMSKVAFQSLLIAHHHTYMNPSISSKLQTKTNHPRVYHHPFLSQVYNISVSSVLLAANCCNWLPARPFNQNNDEDQGPDSRTNVSFDINYYFPTISSFISSITYISHIENAALEYKGTRVYRYNPITS